MIRTLSAVALSAATALFATSALAQDPAAPAQAQTVGTPGSSGTAAQTSADTSSDGSGVSAAILVGYGTNNLNLGFGARVGYTLPMHLYLGVTFMYFLGQSQSSPDGTGGTLSESVHILFPGIEAGYEIPAGPIMVRPYAGLGYVVASSSVSDSGNSALAGELGSVGGSSSNIGFWFGGTALYPVTSSIGVGVDLRFLLVSNSNSFIPALTGQYHF
jgi:opacity protein-like surface antigen